MESLRLTQEILLERLSDYKRYLLDSIDFDNRLIAIKGARGTGKTTLLLQYMKYHLDKKEQEQALYATLDDLYFLENGLLDLAKAFHLNGGKYLFLDEVHKYPRWSRELKLIYDQVPDLHVMFTSSSILDIISGESDLSRRAVSYNLQELSFREFLELETGENLSSYTLDEILKNHKEICKEVKEKIDAPIKHFKDYFDYGAYPYFKESKKTYIQKLQQTIMLIIENDMNTVENISYDESIKIKKLLVAIAQSAPFTPNISKLSERLGMNRKLLLRAIKLLHRADLVIELFKPNKGIGIFTKPEKLYLHNPNIVIALDKNQFKKGTLRETFFANQLLQNHQLHLAEKGDFLVDKKYTFEIGGKNKTGKQLQNVPKSYIVRDDIEYGTKKTIPLWVFGFLY